MDLPDQASSAGAAAGVVICHPHPQYGGEMTNNVVMAITAGIVARGHAALRFNFRGVGRSTGAYGNGIGEQDDARAATDALASGRLLPQGDAAGEPPSALRAALAGYSFGGGVALRAAAQLENLAALALISPAIGERTSKHGDDGDGIAALTMPKLIATGEADAFATVERVRDLAARLPGATEIYISPQTDHFWWGEEQNLARRVGDFLSAALQRSTG